MNRKFLSLVLCGTFLMSCDTLNEVAKTIPSQLPGTTAGLSNSDVVAGLKAALATGTDTAVRRLNAVNGYLNDAVVKILLPKEAQVIFSNISKIPGGQALVDKTITSINRAAEDAAREATPIFKNAITGMSISDAMGILKGHDSAATVYLKGNTYSSLKSTFSPKIESSLSKPLVYGISTAQLYKDLISAYNTASLGGKLFAKIEQNTLGDYVTTKALDGLFTKVAREELLIRKDVSHRVTDILRKVFSQR